MEYGRMKVAYFAAFIFFCCVLGGCSYSFCGFRIKAQEELTFTCEEGLDQEQSVLEIPDVVEEQSVPKIPDIIQEPTGSEAEVSGKVNLNTASLEELMMLRGIGETRARAIMDYRAQNGVFAEIEDIMRIPGIKEGIFSKIKDQITVH